MAQKDVIMICEDQIVQIVINLKNGSWLEHDVSIESAQRLYDSYHEDTCS